jgi:hypothetical protein
MEEFKPLLRWIQYVNYWNLDSRIPVRHKHDTYAKRSGGTSFSVGYVLVFLISTITPYLTKYFDEVCTGKSK